jgi:hypothetical protein
MDINGTGPINRVGADRLPEEQRAEVIQRVRARTAAAGREVLEYQRTVSDRGRVLRDDVVLGDGDEVRGARERGVAEGGRREGPDRMEFSERSRRLASAQATSTADYEKRVEELREEYKLGKIFTPERLERAARRMLSDPS